MDAAAIVVRPVLRKTSRVKQQ